MPSLIQLPHRQSGRVNRLWQAERRPVDGAPSLIPRDELFQLVGNLRDAGQTTRFFLFTAA